MASTPSDAKLQCNEIGSDNKKYKYTARLYCCVENCKNHSRTIDSRTGKPVKLHKFPDPDRETERCKRWLDSIQRPDLHLRNIQHKKVCSAHFEITAYSCQSDIANSLLLHTAVPTIERYPSPPKLKSSRRKTRKQRLPMKRQYEAYDENMCSADMLEDSVPIIEIENAESDT